MSREKENLRNSDPLGADIPENNLRWLAGALEAGGSLGISARTDKKGHSSAYPFIAFNERKEELIDQFKLMFGGCKFRTKGTWGWMANSYRAAYIITALDPWIVSRREIIYGVRNWLESDTAERVQIAHEVKGRNRILGGEVEDYLKLVKDPDFVAGVIDVRGTITPVFRDNYIHPCIGTRSKNQNLLLALKKEYGGDLGVTREVGDIENIFGVETTVKQESYRWTTSFVVAQRLLKHVVESLKIKPFTDWDYSPSEELESEISLQRQTLESIIRDELNALKAGTRSSLSTNDEFAAMLEVSRNTVKARLHSLPVDIRQERGRFLMNQGRQSRRHKVK